MSRAARAYATLSQRLHQVVALPPLGGYRGFGCPNTTTFERWQQHRRNGGTVETFTVGYTLNDIWNRRPNGANRHHLDGHTNRGPRDVRDSCLSPVEGVDA